MKRLLTMLLLGMFLFISCKKESSSNLVKSKKKAVTLTLEGSGN